MTIELIQAADPFFGGNAVGTDDKGNHDLILDDDPLNFCRRLVSDIRRFARANDFPPPPPVCPLSRETRRQRAEELIRQAEKWAKNSRVNLLRAGLRGNEKGDQS